MYSEIPSRGNMNYWVLLTWDSLKWTRIYRVFFTSAMLYFIVYASALFTWTKHIESELANHLWWASASQVWITRCYSESVYTESEVILTRLWCVIHQYINTRVLQRLKNTIQTPPFLCYSHTFNWYQSLVLLLMDIKHLTVSDKDPKVVWENTHGDVTHLLQFQSHILSW